MNDQLAKIEAVHRLKLAVLWLGGTSVLLIGVPLVGLALVPDSSFWTSFLATVIVAFAVGVLVLLARHGRAIRWLGDPAVTEALTDEYDRDSRHRAGNSAFMVTMVLLMVMPLIHYYVKPLSVAVVCYVPMLAGAAVQLLYLHRRLV